MLASQVFREVRSKRSLINFYEKLCVRTLLPPSSPPPSPSCPLKTEAYFLFLSFFFAQLDLWLCALFLSPSLTHSLQPIRYVYVFIHAAFFIHISTYTLLRHQFFMNNSLDTNFYGNIFHGWNLRPTEREMVERRKKEEKINPDKCTISRIAEHSRACTFH